LAREDRERREQEEGEEPDGTGVRPPHPNPQKAHQQTADWGEGANDYGSTGFDDRYAYQPSKKTQREFDNLPNDYGYKIAMGAIQQMDEGEYWVFREPPRDYYSRGSIIAKIHKEDWSRLS